MLVRNEAGGTLWIERDPGAGVAWLRFLARKLARREAAALEVLAGIDGVPQIVGWRNGKLVRTYIPGRPLSAGLPSDPD